MHIEHILYPEVLYPQRPTLLATEIQVKLISADARSSSQQQQQHQQRRLDCVVQIVPTAGGGRYRNKGIPNSGDGLQLPEGKPPLSYGYVRLTTGSCTGSKI